MVDDSLIKDDIKNKSLQLIYQLTIIKDDPQRLRKNKRAVRLKKRKIRKLYERTSRLLGQSIIGNSEPVTYITSHN